MVKGISKQVIVVQSPDEKLFEQAIFIIKDNMAGVTDEMLMQEAKRLINTTEQRKRKRRLYGPAWACGGALAMAAAWGITALF